MRNERALSRDTPSSCFCLSPSASGSSDDTARVNPIQPTRIRNWLWPRNLHHLLGLWSKIRLQLQDEATCRFLGRPGPRSIGTRSSQSCWILFASSTSPCKGRQAENQSERMVEAGGVEPPSEKRCDTKPTCLAQFRCFRPPRSE
jgi:hypothetical protein